MNASSPPFSRAFEFPESERSREELRSIVVETATERKRQGALMVLVSGELSRIGTETLRPASRRDPRARGPYTLLLNNGDVRHARNRVDHAHLDTLLPVS